MRRPKPRNPGETEMTKEEFKKIKKSMKDEKFHELLGDYMKEISDPNNMDEYDQYLKQLKNEGELPEGMELVQPTPHFVIKSNLASNTDKKYTQSIYINICSHECVQKPSINTINNRKQWSIPYLVSKVRYDQHDDSVVNTVDVVYHIQSIDKTREHSEYKRIVAYE